MRLNNLIFQAPARDVSKLIRRQPLYPACDGCALPRAFNCYIKRMVPTGYDEKQDIGFQNHTL